MTLTFAIEVRCPVCEQPVALPVLDSQTTHTPVGASVVLVPDMTYLEEHLKFWHR